MPTAADSWPGASALVATARDAIIGETLDGSIASWNGASEALLGWSTAEALGRPLVDLAGPALAAVEDLQAPFEATLQGRGGRRIAAIISTSPVIGSDGVRVGRSHIIRALAASGGDQLDGQLDQLSRLGAMGQLAPVLAHELKQPLTAIVSYLTSARRLMEPDRPPDREAFGVLLEEALGQARRADQIVRHLRSFVSDGLAEREPADVVALLAEVGELVTIPARQAGVAVHHALGPEATVLIDRVQMQQVLFNLMRNAIEAMAGGSSRELHISAIREDDIVRIRVADTGPGLAPEVAARLFEPFVTTKPDGMGLGLAICRRIVERHGGRLWFESGANGGLIACFTLPLAAGEGDWPQPLTA